MAPTASLALTLAAIVAVASFASPVAILICGVPMLFIAIAFRRLNRWRVNCGATYVWGGRAVSPYFGFAVGWIIQLAYLVGVVSIVLPIGPYLASLFGQSNRRPLEAVIGFAATILVTVVAYVGIRTSAWVQWLLIAIEYVGITILAIYSLVGVFGHQAHAVSFHLSWLGWGTLGGVGGLVAAALIAVYLFSGWDTAILLNEETTNPKVTPGNAVVTTVVVVGFMFAVLTFAFQGAVSTRALESHSDALSYVGQVRGGLWLGTYMVLAVGLSALGSTRATLVSGVRITFAMSADGVLPSVFGKTHATFKTPHVATIVVAGLAAAGVWIFSLGSNTVQASFTTMVSVDGLLFALFYALTGVATAVYFRKRVSRRRGSAILLVLMPALAAVFLFFISWDSVSGLGGWTGGSMVSLYVMFAIGAAVMAWGRWRARSAYYRLPREADDPDEATAAV